VTVFFKSSTGRLLEIIETDITCKPSQTTRKQQNQEVASCKSLLDHHEGKHFSYLIDGEVTSCKSPLLDHQNASIYHLTK